jgi:hypothetical protein
MSGIIRSSALRIVVVFALTCAAVSLLAGCITVTPPATSQPTPAPTPAPAPTGTTFKVGDRVAAPWGGGQYIGSVTALSGDKSSVLYDDDKVTREIANAELTLVAPKTWAVGDKVMAVWSSGKFYAGTITAAKAGDIYTVKWDDGSTPSDVEAAKIFAK